MSTYGWSPYKDLILKYSKVTGVPGHIIAAVIEQESGGQPDVVSKAGAVGLMQIVQRLHPVCGTVAMLKGPEANILCGAGILRDYNRLVCDRLSLNVRGWKTEVAILGTLACYNAGPGNVKLLDQDNWPGETKQYVQHGWSLSLEYMKEFGNEPRGIRSRGNDGGAKVTKPNGG